MDDPFSSDLFSFLHEVDDIDILRLLSPSPPPPPPQTQEPSQPRSAFSNYERVGSSGDGGFAGRSVGSADNVHQRLFGFLRRIGETTTAAVEGERGREGAADQGWARGFRHMMRERQRRERISQGYADLHAMLYSLSKGDKNSIVKAAATHVRDLKCKREQLRRRNEELEVMAAAQRPAAAAMINLTIANCSTRSAMEALTAALQCSKLMELKVTAVRSSFSGEDFSMVVGLETKVDAAQVEKAITRALADAEKNFCSPKSTQQSKWSLICHVENVT